MSPYQTRCFGGAHATLVETHRKNVLGLTTP
jgi:hypothetical protein